VNNPKSKKKSRKPLVRISDKQVRDLRRRAKKGESTRQLATRFNIHITCVQDIIALRTRKDA
jgi:hypothetical protein